MDGTETSGKGEVSGTGVAGNIAETSEQHTYSTLSAEVTEFVPQFPATELHQFIHTTTRISVSPVWHTYEQVFPDRNPVHVIPLVPNPWETYPGSPEQTHYYASSPVLQSSCDPYEQVSYDPKPYDHIYCQDSNGFPVPYQTVLPVAAGLPAPYQPVLSAFVPAILNPSMFAERSDNNGTVIPVQSIAQYEGDYMNLYYNNQVNSCVPAESICDNYSGNHVDAYNYQNGNTSDLTNGKENAGPYNMEVKKRTNYKKKYLSTRVRNANRRHYEATILNHGSIPLTSATKKVAKNSEESPNFESRSLSDLKPENGVINSAHSEELQSLSASYVQSLQLKEECETSLGAQISDICPDDSGPAFFNSKSNEDDGVAQGKFERKILLPLPTPILNFQASNLKPVQKPPEKINDNLGMSDGASGPYMKCIDEGKNELHVGNDNTKSKVQSSDTLDTPTTPFPKKKSAEYKLEKKRKKQAARDQKTYDVLYGPKDQKLEMIHGDKMGKILSQQNTSQLFKEDEKQTLPLDPDDFPVLNSVPSTASMSFNSYSDCLRSVRPKVPMSTISSLPCGINNMEKGYGFLASGNSYEPTSSQVTKQVNQTDQLTAKKKPKPNDLITVDIGAAIQKLKDLKNEKPNDGFKNVCKSKHAEKALPQNMFVDSIGNVRYKGKQREVPKKPRPSLMKKVAVADRTARKESTEMQQAQGATCAEFQVCEPANMALETYKPLTYEQLVKMAKEQIHTNRFRPYCDHNLCKKLDSLVLKLLDYIVRYQGNAYSRNPIKYTLRYVCGIRDVSKRLPADFNFSSPFKMIVIAPNMEFSTSENSPMAIITKIIEIAKLRNIPYIFASNRTDLSKHLLHKSGSFVSVVGVIDYQGTETMDIYTMIQERLQELQKQYAMHLQYVIESIRNQQMSDMNSGLDARAIETKNVTDALLSKFQDAMKDK